MTLDCANQPKIPAQTLFLGASIANISSNMGWGGQPSQLTVTLIEDKAYCFKNNTIASQFKKLNYPDNHYQTCVGDNCYVTPDGDQYDSSKHTTDQKMVPGKVYYEFLSDGNLVSKYWYDPDPGFFGLPNRIKPDNTFYDGINETQLNRGYDIIDTPVFLKMGNFSFGGVVQSWNKSKGQNGEIINVTINSMQNILDKCYLILSHYAGSIYSKKTGDTNTIFGKPRGYAGAGLDYFGHMFQGNIPNVFNVYGFLESFGLGGFGGSKSSPEGISVSLILEALLALTSITDNSTHKLTTASSLGSGTKNAFSPYGRILTKCMQENVTYDAISPSFRRMGVIPPEIIGGGGFDPTPGALPKCSFVLDLSDLMRISLPNEFRLNGPVISVMELINIIADQTGNDFNIDLIPTAFNNRLYNVIKVKTISRLSQPSPYQLNNIVKGLECAGYWVSANNIGKEKNENNARSVIVGGKQQRLYQAKSLRLAYTQTSFIFNPRTGKFVNYMQLGSSDAFANAPVRVSQKQFHHGKTKIPSVFFTNNPTLSNIVNPFFAPSANEDNDIAQSITGKRFTDTDADWNDTSNVASGKEAASNGNYYASNVIKQENSDTSTWGFVQGANDQRFFPIYKDVISPFFGFVLESEQPVDTSGKNNDFRRVRPVWFDTWTGQLVIILKTSELPVTNVNLEALATSNGQGYFLLTESEIRAALAGFDNFLVYCISRTYKNDLIEMLRRAYVAKTTAKFILEGMDAATAKRYAEQEHDWYWNLIGANISGPYFQPIDVTPDKVDGSYEMDQEAIQDLQIIHNFITNDIGKYYGKKYMVMMPRLYGYQDNDFANLVLPTLAGDAYVFRGGGETTYNYEPTNDGAWEEYGNIIDDTISFGSREWLSLTDDQGKIKPILGYNLNDNFDYVRYNICTMTTQNYNSFVADKMNPYWSYATWKIVLDERDGSCSKEKFILPSIDLSSLSPDSYVLLNVENYNSNGQIFNQYGVSNPTAFPGTQISSFATRTTAKDAWGESVFDSANTPAKMKKAYVTTQIDEKIIFLDPLNLREPRVLIDAPGLTLYSHGSDKAKDPNRRVVGNVAIEDLAIYLKSTSSNSWDRDFIKFLLYYVSPTEGDDGFMIGNFAASANVNNNYVEMAPKAAHPFFAGIPIKFQNHSYGPWINYPYAEYLENPNNIFPSGYLIKSCNNIEQVNIDSNRAKKAFDNWILPTNVEVKEDFVPWNYGGIAFLDSVAYLEARSKVNYQSVIETAQIDMVGLPLFSLGGSFTSGISNPPPTISTGTISKIEQSERENTIATALAGLPLTASVNLPPTISVTQAFNYSYLKVDTRENYLEGPLITNIMTTMGQQGVTTTYSFRTYTRKLSLFNKEYSDRIKKTAINDLKRNKQASSLQQKTNNLVYNQTKFLRDAQLQKASFSNSDFSSKLFGWSPSTVFIGQASPHITSPDRTPEYSEPSLYYSSPSLAFDSSNGAPRQWSIKSNSDRGADSTVNSNDYLTTSTSRLKLTENMRIKTSVSLYQMKEVNPQLQNDYGLQSMMSIDGLFSPISFYPTLKNSTYHMNLYDKKNCPFCNGTKKIKIETVAYLSNGQKDKASSIYIHCDKCAYPDQKKVSTQASKTSLSIETLPPYIITSGTDITTLLSFNKNLSSSSTTSSSSSSNNAISINLYSLQPLIMPYGDFQHPYTQSYVGPHPDGIHDDLSIGPYNSTNKRYFIDRSRHSIEIVGRGAVIPKKLGISDTLTENVSGHMTAYYHKDVKLQDARYRREGINVEYPMNQRFLGLRGPLMMHGWGYDTEGYPVPNAADEPYEYDSYGRPKRFKLKIKDGYPKATTYKQLQDGALFSLSVGGNQFIKSPRLTASDLGLSTSTIADTTSVQEYQYENDMKNAGGFPTQNSPLASNDRTLDFQGDIISKTQKYVNGEWTKKQKLRQFYLNFGERPDLWPVGPIDLRWDNNRKVWTANNPASIYKFVYVTLEEDLVKDENYDETYPARGFLDDVEYSKEPLPLGSRRLVYIKDRCGYTAPRGVKLLCRYDSDSGYYEPITKPVIMTSGRIDSGNRAVLEMSYVQGRKRGEIPTMLVTFDNTKFNLPISTGKNGLFTFMGGKWILTQVQN